MAEYIGRESLIDWLTKPTGFRANCEDCTEIDCLDCIVEEAIRNSPAADVVEVKHGRWIIDKSFLPFVCTCSVCGWSTDTDGAFEWKGCPDCLARMEGEG